MLLAVAIALRDREALGLAAIVLLGVLLLRFRRGKAGAILLGLLFADLLFFTIPGAASNIIHSEELTDTLIPASLAAISIGGFIAPIALVLFKLNPEGGGRVVRFVGQAAVGLLIVVLSVGALARAGGKDRARRGDITVLAENTAFSRKQLTVPAGEVGIFLSNKDLFWHTLTIDELDFDLKVPVGGDRRGVLNAKPGTYTYYCRVPGHTLAGMKGTITVTP